MGLAILRLVLVCHSLAAFAQSVFAGQFLSGIDGPVKFHEWTGWIALAISVLQVIVVSALMRSRVASLWLLFGSVFLLLGEALQIGTGYGRFLNVHIPLGVIVFAVATWQTISVFLKRSGGPRK
ncbi:MAG TPA: hypothetical protein VNX18_10725 [Bryobacteraceae bacterium]|nr:hypothetical protein [Bryobacteraceae bacterium]